jgi:hypothetical protein
MFKKKSKVIRERFNEVVGELIRKVYHQKNVIIQSYGPLILNPLSKQRPIFEINKEIDKKGYRDVQYLRTRENKLAQIINIRIKTVRCLKDRVSNGHFILKVSVLDRLGGS